MAQIDSVVVAMATRGGASASRRQQRSGAPPTLGRIPMRPAADPPRRRGRPRPCPVARRHPAAAAPTGPAAAPAGGPAAAAPGPASRRSCLSSPWLRAWQTAQLTAEHAGAPRTGRLPRAGGGPRVLAPLAAAIGPTAAGSRRGAGRPRALAGRAGRAAPDRRTDGLPMDFPKSGVAGARDATDSGAGGARLEFFWRPEGGSRPIARPGTRARPYPAR